MGHACAVFKDRIWLLGGADANGRALKEVWSWSGKDGEAWTPHPEPAVWTATTLLSAAADESRLYVYGGADEPFGTPHTGLYCTEDGETWSVAELRGDAAGTGDLGYGQPFGSGLCVTRAGKSRHLRILGTYRPHATSSTFGPVALKYDRGGLTRFDEGLDEEGNGWTTRREGDGWQPFRLSAIGFRSSIFVASVLYKTNSPSLTYYVAGDPT
jgi:hypothetical protein